MKFLIVLACAIATVAGQCSYDDVKKCYNLEYMFSDGGFQWPKDDGSVQTLCGKLMEGGQCFKAFVDKCSKIPAAKEEFNKKLGAVKLYHESVCGNPDGRKAFLERIQCYSNPAVVAPMKDAHQKYVAMVEKLPSYDKGARKQALCCSVLFLKDAAKGPVGANCQKNVVDYLKGLLQTVSAAFQDKCGSVTEFNACVSALPANIAGDFKAIASGPVPSTQNKIAFPTLFKMWEDM